MKAIDINGNIKVYNQLPSSWQGVMGNFSKLSDEEIKAYGFYDVIIPEFNVKTQELSNLFFDNDLNIFTYIVNNKTWKETLEELKEQAIKNLSIQIKQKLSETDWYVTRQVERNIDIPQNVQDAREILFNSHSHLEEEINNLTKKSDVVTYEFK